MTRLKSGKMDLNCAKYLAKMFPDVDVTMNSEARENFMNFELAEIMHVHA